MKGSWRIGRIAGIDVFVHFTFLLLVGYWAWAHYAIRREFADALVGVASILVLFFIVVLHELGHALAARRYGIQTRDITLLPIGGLARLERMPDDPRQELVVALAGPLVNIVIAGSICLGLLIGGELHAWDVLMTPGGKYIGQLMWVNIVLAVFNLIPAFPMDGGRVLRALLALRMDYVKATAIAASIGQGMAALLCFAGLFWNPMLVLIAIFVWLGAEAEAKQVALGSALSGIPARDAMITRFVTLLPGNTIGDAATVAHGGFQQDFPVVDGTNLVGLLPRRYLAEALKRQPATTPVSEVMERDFAVADPGDTLQKVQRMLAADDSVDVVPVLHHGQLQGLVTPESVGRYLVLRRGLRPQTRVA